ncbi:MULTISPECIES: DUF3291 domain-containing protein [Streptomyces]|uniref:DUF3291 domain-containing protein n=1 Tax=Streptomyces TaxID=1883 RepID=UPI000D521268|nr:MULTISPECIES: DUF3291 domain-containing protein [Streptomyces]PVC74912.1 hypothetical protein DBP15_08625 [Streptomyces sp. CS065A]
MTSIGVQTDDAGHALAQVNIARLRFPLDSPELRDFVDGLDSVNAVADAEERLLHLREHGPAERAFTSRTRFPAPAGVR